ncbi:hypothetical protein GCM10022291_18340 [Postechiella marina]|uniref:Uncharacterized protein n=1 Tax=Postechiella marina TaxID=943941 RepID=A0ABP8C8R1_9FLAO
MKKNCKHCNEIFNARRRNHLYCSPSCKTLASYKRNNYKYAPGHYQKRPIAIKETGTALTTKKTETAITELEKKIKKIDNVNMPSISNAALGTMAAEVAISGVKRLFAPNTLPATKEDIESLKNEINAIKALIQRKAH